MNNYFLITVCSIFILCLSCSYNNTPTKEVCSKIFTGTSISKFVTTDPSSAISMPVPSAASQSIKISPMNNLQFGEYFISLDVGQQVVNFVVDTGSSNLIIAQGFTADQTKFVGQDYSVSYGSGSGLASEYKDNVNFTCDDVKIDFTLGILKQNNNLPNILGLAYQSLAQPQNPPDSAEVPFFEQLVAQSAMKNMFSMALCGHKTGDVIVFGDRVPGIEAQSVTYVPVTNQEWYVIDVNALYVVDWALDTNNNWLPSIGSTTSVGLFQDWKVSGNIPTIVDSGSTMNYFPPKVYTEALRLLKAVSTHKSLGIPEAFWNAAPGSNNYSIPLSTNIIAQLPQFKLAITSTQTENAYVDLLPDTYLKALTANPNYRTSSFRQSNGLNILGQAFMEGHYVEFNLESTPNLIGFASNSNICK